MPLFRVSTSPIQSQHRLKKKKKKKVKGVDISWYRNQKSFVPTLTNFLTFYPY